MKKVKAIVFVNTPVSELNDDRMEPPLGMLYLATILHNLRIPCVICDLAGTGDNEEKWLKMLQGVPVGDIYAFSTYSVTYYRTLRIKELIKQNINPSAITVAGGPHVSALPEESKNDFDIVVTGEAEKTFPEIVNQIINGENLKGIFIGVPEDNLDSIPFPDYSLVDMSSYHRIVEGRPSFSVLSTRGCPFRCYYCNSRVSNRGKLRFRSVANVVGEILLLKERNGSRNFRFNDDLFTCVLSRTRKMASAFNPLDILYRIFAQAKTLIPETCELLYASGCRHVSIGIETMSDEMMINLGKKSSVRHNIIALQNCQNAGLKTRIYLIVGFPGETEKTVLESIEVFKNLGIEGVEFIVYPFIPYPGTPVWYDPGRFGIRKIDRDFSKFVQVGQKRSTCFTIWTDTFGPDDVQKWRQITIDTLESFGYVWAGESRDNR